MHLIGYKVTVVNQVLYLMQIKHKNLLFNNVH